MSFIDKTRSVERQTFFDGQRLFSDDMQAIEGFNREMRWLHNQSLHQPGIGNGFAATGKRGDRDVVIGPGYAIDDGGREIVLTTPRTVPVPPVAGADDGGAQRYVLTVQYPSDDDLEEVERREGICDTSGAVRLREEPTFCWVPLNPDGSPARDQAEILSGHQVILTEIEVRDCKLDREISIAQRRDARPHAQPYIAAGTENPTLWEWWAPWETDPEGDDEPVESPLELGGGLRAEINTSSAGFRTTPRYFARLDGPRFIQRESDGTTDNLLVDGLLSIVDPGPSGFVVEVVLIVFAGSEIGDGEVPEWSDQWRIVWMGVEG